MLWRFLRRHRRIHTIVSDLPAIYLQKLPPLLDLAPNQLACSPRIFVAVVASGASLLDLLTEVI